MRALLHRLEAVAGMDSRVCADRCSCSSSSELEAWNVTGQACCFLTCATCLELLPAPADLSRCPGLKCRSGRAVEFHSKSGKLVPVLMELTERATDTGEAGVGTCGQMRDGVGGVWRQPAQTRCWWRSWCSACTNPLLVAIVV